MDGFVLLLLIGILYKQITMLVRYMTLAVSLKISLVILRFIYKSFHPTMSDVLHIMLKDSLVCLGVMYVYVNRDVVIRIQSSINTSLSI